MTVSINFNGHAIDYNATPPHHWTRCDMNVVMIAHMDRLDWRFSHGREVPDALFCSRDARLNRTKAVTRQLRMNAEGLFDYATLFSVLFHGSRLMDYDPVDYLGRPFKRGQKVFNPELIRTPKWDVPVRLPVSSIEFPARRIRW